jgi:sulfopyruvate decarboxylase subunit beta
VQRPEEELIGILKKNGIDFTASLPCEKIKNLISKVSRAFHHIPLTREEEGVGICAGAALSGRLPAMFIQSSGIGNMINALLSLTAFYELPLALFVSRRGVYNEKIEAQMPVGQRLPAILAGAGITYTIINTRQDFGMLDRELADIKHREAIHAFLMSPAVWEGSECGSLHPTSSSAQPREWGVRSAGCKVKTLKKSTEPGSSTVQTPSAPTLTRYEIINTAAPYLKGKVVVSNLGWPSKELYAIQHQPSNFYMLGSMGMATPIGLGIALTSEDKKVVVIDGDGSLLMNPGTLATTAALAPKNLTILAIDNGAYGSTGNQPTYASACVDLEQVAKGFGFRHTVKAVKEEEIVNAVKKKGKVLTFIHALAVPGNKDVPNIPVHHLEIKKQVQDVLKGR